MSGREASGTESTDENAKRLGVAISGLVDGCNAHDVQRALIAVMSTGICVACETKEQAMALMAALVVILHQQVLTDHPVIRKAMAEDAPSPHLLPSTKM